MHSLHSHIHTRTRLLSRPHQAAAAVLRIVLLCPYIWSYMHRLRIVYSLLPWTWEVST